MKNNLRTIILVLSCIIALPYFAKAQGKTAYGFTRDYPYALVSLNTSDPSTAKRVGSTDVMVTAGAAVKENMYVVGMDEDFNTLFYSVDLTTGELTKIKNLGESAALPMDMSYDYDSETMFFVTNSDNVDDVSALETINVTTGAIKKITDNTGYFYRAIAIDEEGQIYGLTGQGELTKIDKKTGKSTMIGKTGNVPSSFQSMDFDRATGKLYWSWKDASNKSKLMTIDIETAKATEVGTIGSGNGIWTIALNVPYVPSLNAAPAKVKNLKAAADANGELSATISWVNPDSTTNDSRLKAISKVVILRDTVAIDSFKNVKPGQEMTYTDKVEKTGMYRYNVKAYNEIGSSADVFTKVWIGHDAPDAPTEVSATIYDGKTNNINWLAPTTGKHSGYVNLNDLKYDVIRVNDGVKIASAIKDLATEDDNLADTLTRYTYKVVSYNEDGQSDSTLSNYVVNGPSRQIPFTASFKTWNEAQLWTVNNLNNDETTFVWAYDPVTDQNEYVYSTSDYLYANDWLISPPIEFQEGKTYIITVSATNDFPVYSESFRIYSTPLNTPNGAVALGEEFTVNNPNKFQDFSVSITIPGGGNAEPEKFTSFIAVVCTSIYGSHNFLVNSVSVKEDVKSSIASNMNDNQNIEEAVLRTIDGKIVGKSSSVKGLNIDSQAKGMYILSTKNGNNIQTKKIVVK